MKKINLGKNHYALVDNEDYKILKNYTWAYDKHSNNRYYARTRFYKHKRIKPIRMHRLVLNIIDPRIKIDHKDGNGLNNQKKNLRICNDSENGMNRDKQINNTSGYKGVSYLYKYYKGIKSIRKKPWLAQICINQKYNYLGYFYTAKEAALAYDKKAKELHGEFARLNFPNE